MPATAYISRASVETRLPPRFLTDALDDDADGVEDAGLLDRVIESASERVDAFIGQRYNLPLAQPVPGLVTEAALVFTLEALYERRGMIGEGNPYSKSANSIRERLGRIASGEEALFATIKQANASATVIAEPARLQSGRKATHF